MKKDVAMKHGDRLRETVIAKVERARSDARFAPVADPLSLADSDASVPGG
jgi:hypothetical protein